MLFTEKINEVYEEEQYRHVAGHCHAIENKLLFDRQSLHDRYLKNCQFGVRDAMAAKAAPVVAAPPTASTPTSLVALPPSRGQDRERHCFSAGALVKDKDDHDDEDDADDGEELADGEPLGRSRGRSHSAVCHSAALRAYGMTLPDPRPAPPGHPAPACPPAEERAKDEGEDGGWDEGYGSKVSSNDQEAECGAEEEEVEEIEVSARTVEGEGAAEGAGPASHSRKAAGGLVLQPGSVQPLISHQEAMARLMYSRREDTVYERLPSRRMRGNSFRYAGREQSRLMEASLSHITPAYLARYRHLADLAANAAEARHSQQRDKGGDGDRAAAPLSQGAEGGAEDGDGGRGEGPALQPRTMVLRKITIQDSARDFYPHNGYALPAAAACATGPPAKAAVPSPQFSQPFDKVHRRQALLSPSLPRPERSVSETRPRVSESLASDMPRSGKSEPVVTMTVQELTPELSPSRDAILHTARPALSLGGGDDPQGGAPSSSSPSTLAGGQAAGSPGDSRLTMSTFAMTDLLPAVERNLRFQRSSQRGLSKSKAMDVTANVGNVSGRRQQQPQQQAAVRRNNSEGSMVNGAQQDAQVDVRAGLNGTTMTVKRPPADDVSCSSLDRYSLCGVACWLLCRRCRLCAQCRRRRFLLVTASTFSSFSSSRVLLSLVPLLVVLVVVMLVVLLSSPCINDYGGDGR